MASPFDVFRKNQKVLMALLVGFSMVAFIVADSINVTNFPIFLGAIFGALALWLLSGKSGGEGWAIAAVGGVLGALVGVYGPGLVGGNAVVRTAEGDLSRQDINRILEKQDQANRFLNAAAFAVAEKLPDAEKRRIRPQSFGFGNPSTPEGRTESALMTFLFQKEADDLGITISDAAVSQFLESTFDGKLTELTLKRVLNELRLGTGELVEVLRDQIRAREAFLLLVPRTSATPQELWAEYKKLETQAQVTAVTLPTEAFVAQVPDPSATELAAFFDQYKAVPAPAEGAPGFLVPRQFQVAYVQIDMDEVRKSVTPPTDEEVLAFFEANRAQFEFDEPVPPAERLPIEAPRPAAAASEPAAPAAEGTTDEPPAEAPQNPSSPEQPAAPETPPGESGSALRRDGFEFVSFQAGEAGPAAAASAPADEASAAPLTPPAFPAPPARDKKPPRPETLKLIREDLLNQRARAEADRRLEKVREDVNRMIVEIYDAVPMPEDLGDEESQRQYEAQRKAAVTRVVERLREYAKANGLKTATTPYLSFQELSESENYPIGSTVLWEPNRPFGQPETTPLAVHVDQMSPEQPLSAIATESRLNGDRFVVLKIADVPPRQPTLDQKGVKEQVVEAWKLQQARSLAEKRAQELAKADDGKTDLAEAVKGQTFSGKPDGRPLTARELGPFPWLRRSTAPTTSFAPQDFVPTTLPELPAAGEEFMRAVFEEATPGQAVVAASADGSAFYVVEVDRRELSGDLDKVRQEFMGQDFFNDPFGGMFGVPMNPYRRRMMIDAQRLSADWIEAFRTKHGVSGPAGAETPPAA